MAEDAERLLAFGRMGLETGYYDQARDSFERVLAMDPSSREAIEGLGRANEMLRRMAAARLASRYDPAPRAESAARVEAGPPSDLVDQYEPARQEPARPPPRVEPQATVPEWESREWGETSGLGFQAQEAEHGSEGDRVEIRDEENRDYEWLSIQLKHVPITTWTIVLAKVGVAAAFLGSILAIIQFVISMVLEKIDLSNILDALPGF